MIAESIHTTFTPLSPSLFTPHQILYIAPLTSREACIRGYLLARVLHRRPRSIFRLYDHVNTGMTVGTGAHTVHIAKFEYADDAALIDEDAGQATARVTSLAAGLIADAAMIIFAKKSKVMPIHKTTRTSATTEADVAKLNLVHMCEPCTREFTRLRGLKMHMTRWCDGGPPYAAITSRLLDRQSRQVEQEMRS